jgi:hypothetical protein
MNVAGPQGGMKASDSRQTFPRQASGATELSSDNSRSRGSRSQQGAVILRPGVLLLVGAVLARPGPSSWQNHHHTLPRSSVVGVSLRPQFSEGFEPLSVLLRRIAGTSLTVGRSLVVGRLPGGRASFGVCQVPGGARTGQGDDKCKGPAAARPPAPLLDYMVTIRPAGGMVERREML